MGIMDNLSKTKKGRTETEEFSDTELKPINNIQFSLNNSEESTDSSTLQYSGRSTSMVSGQQSPSEFDALADANVHVKVSKSNYISENTVVDGNIRSFEDIEISGNVKGNVETTKSLIVNGRIVGNITCDNATMNSSSIQGNMLLKGNAVMTGNAMLIGDLTAQTAEISGKIKGNLNITGKVNLEKDAVIFGEIKAGAISMEDGAIVQGSVTTTYLSNEEKSNIFPETIVFGE